MKTRRYNHRVLRKGPAAQCHPAKHVGWLSRITSGTAIGGEFGALHPMQRVGCTEGCLPRPAAIADNIIFYNFVVHSSYGL